MTSSLHIDWIDQNHCLLPDVMSLGKKHSATLGFMPEGGFEDHARGEILSLHQKTETFRAI